MSDLRPCPFCGKKAKLVRGGPGNVFVQCQWCMASTDDCSKERAIERWNRRTPDPTLDLAKVEALVEAGNVMAQALRGDYIVPGSAAAWFAALAAMSEVKE